MNEKEKKTGSTEQKGSFKITTLEKGYFDSQVRIELNRFTDNENKTIDYIHATLYIDGYSIELKPCLSRNDKHALSKILLLQKGVK